MEKLREIGVTVLGALGIGVVEFILLLILFFNPPIGVMIVLLAIIAIK